MEPLSECCGAPMLGEPAYLPGQDEIIGICGRCRDWAEFKEEDEEDNEDES